MKVSKEEKLFMRSFFGKVGKAIFDYNMIEEGDRVLVGISGGKDSLTLLNVLASRARSQKNNYTIIAAHIAVDSLEYEVDKSYLEKMCEELGVEFVSKSISFGEAVDKPMCFVCSWNRRKALFEIAKEYNCNKLALGHHKDDSIVSLLMSMMFNGTIAAMPPKLAMFDNTFELIRPLTYVTNAETLKFSLYKKFPLQKKNCQYEKKTNRDAVAELLNKMEELSPEVRSNIFSSMKNIRKEYLP